MSKLCKACGSEMPDEARFCTECGSGEFVEAAVGGDTSSVAAGAATASPQGEANQPQFVEQPAAQPVFDGRPMQQPYGQQPNLYGPAPAQQTQFISGQQPYGATSSNVNAGYAGSPQGEGYPQYQQPYQQQPYQQQPYGQPYGAPYAYGAAPAPKSKKGLVIAIIAIILVLGLAAVALFVWPGFLNKKGIEGRWINDRTGFALEFKGGKATVSSDKTESVTEYGFTQDGDTLKLEKDGELLDYIVKVVGDALTLYYDDDGVSFPETYTRDGAEQPEGRDIVGRWGNDNINEFIIDDSTIREIGEDADGEYDISFTYTREGDKLTITEDLNPENTFVRTYEVEDGELTLRDEDGNVTATFNEKGASELLVASYGGMDGVWLNDTGKEFVIKDGTLTSSANGRTYTLTIDGDNFILALPSEDYTEEYTFEYDGAKILLYWPESGGLAATLTRKMPAAPDVPQSGLFGKWISVNDPDEYFVFNADGTGVYWDEDFTYTFTGDGFELKNSYGTYPYSYKIEDNILTLTDEDSDESYDYYREGTTPPAAEVDEYILGRWVDDYGIELNIYADGSGDYGGGKISVSTHNGMLYWVDLDKDNTFYYTYELKDGVLIVRDDNGGISYFKRPGAEVTIDDLVGSWQTDDGYAMVITSDGYLTMMSDGTVYKMEINGDRLRLYIENSEFDETTRFLLSGDDLKFLEEDGEIISIYHRQKQ